MKLKKYVRFFLLVAMLPMIPACGGGTGSNGVKNQPPVAIAGNAQTVIAGVQVTLTGSGTDNDGNITGYAWTQTAGDTVTLFDADTAITRFIAPRVTADTILSFTLTVFDNDDATGTDSIDITVQPSSGGNFLTMPSDIPILREDRATHSSSQIYRHTIICYLYKTRSSNTSFKSDEIHDQASDRIASSIQMAEPQAETILIS